MSAGTRPGQSALRLGDRDLLHRAASLAALERLSEDACAAGRADGLPCRKLLVFRASGSERIAGVEHFDRAHPVRASRCPKRGFARMRKGRERTGRRISNNTLFNRLFGALPAEGESSSHALSDFVRHQAHSAPAEGQSGRVSVARLPAAPLPASAELAGALRPRPARSSPSLAEPHGTGGARRRRPWRCGRPSASIDPYGHPSDRAAPGFFPRHVIHEESVP